MTAGERLDAARRALGPGFNPVGPPSRPARSPDLDLRLRPAMPGHQPPTSFAHPELVETLGPQGGGNRDVVSSRASMLTTRTGVSVAPSFLSGSSAFESEAPQIVTRRQVQTGVVQQAAVVDLSGHLAPIGRNLTAGDTKYGWNSSDGGDRSPGALSARSAMSGASDPFDDKRADRASGNTFGKMLDSADGHERGEDDTRGDHGTYGLGLGDPTDDLRFSMGSLAMGAGNPSRDSVNSSMTGWSVGQVQVGQAQRVNLATTPQKSFNRPVDMQSAHYQQPHYQRESVMSGRSEASSFLNAIIPPSGPMSTPYEKMPSGMSNMTLGNDQASPSKRDTSATRQTMMSTHSEGLGGFDFRFDGNVNGHGEGGMIPGPPRRRPA